MHLSTHYSRPVVHNYFSQRETYCIRTTEFGLYEVDTCKAFFDSFVTEKVRKKTLKENPSQ